MFLSKAGVSQEQEEGDEPSFILAQHIAGHKTFLWSSVSAKYSSVSSSSQERGGKQLKDSVKRSSSFSDPETKKAFPIEELRLTQAAVMFSVMRANQNHHTP